MKTSIIDVGTISIKHFIFNGKRQIYFFRDSTIKLGATISGNNLDEDRMNAALTFIKAELDKDAAQKVDKAIICGTDAIRKAANSHVFIDLLKKQTGLDLKVITHDDESLLFGKGLSRVAPDEFAAFAAGGGSFEAIIFKDGKWHSFKFPFGINRLYEFLKDDYEKGVFNNRDSWNRLKRFLTGEIDKAFSGHEYLSVDIAFLSSVLTFITAQKDIIKKGFEKSTIEEHPIFLYVDDYESALQKLIDAGVQKLRENYSSDPNFADHSAIAQTFYLLLARKLGVKKVYPSEFQYVHGLLES